MPVSAKKANCVCKGGSRDLCNFEFPRIFVTFPIHPTGIGFVWALFLNDRNRAWKGFVGLSFRKRKGDRKGKKVEESMYVLHMYIY